jgi:flavin reductase
MQGQEMDPTHAPPDDFIAGMRQLASSVSVVTTMIEGLPHGITVTSLTSVSAHPPTLLVCIHDASRSAIAIRTAKKFCVNVLSERAVATAELFAGRPPTLAEERFERVEWTPGKTGSPVLADTLIVFECELEQATQIATHWVLIGRVVEVRLGRGKALLYADRSFRALESN